ncbi:MAG: hypothetical protein ACJ8AQ_05430, partial [Gemmatimonadales bacterium]
AAIRADRQSGGLDGSGHELLYVPTGNEREFLAPQPREVLPELEPDMRFRLDEYQLELVGEVASIAESALCAVFGREGRVLRARARGIDPRPVLSPEQQSVFCLVHTLSSDTNDLGVLHPVLRLLSERLGRRLRHRELAAGRLRLQATYADYTTVTRSVPLTAELLDAELWDAARQAFAMANTKRLAVRSLALTLDQLVEKETQLELWAGQTGSEAAGQQGHEESANRVDCPAAQLPRGPADLQHAIDHIHARYGAGALRQGVPLTARRPALRHQTITTLPKVALPSSTRCASAS